MNDTNPALIDISAENAQQMLIDESFKRPVMADFWADWCEPCKQLAPILEKLAAEYNGDFLLARINADQQQMIAQQLGVRSLPTVMLIQDGQPVDGFAGLQTESAIREMLDKYLPKPWDKQLQQAQTLMGEGQYRDAADLLRDAWRDSGHKSPIGLHLAQCCLELNRLDEVQNILDSIPMADQDALYQHVQAELKLRRTAAKTPELEALIQQLQQDPDKLSLKMQLAAKYWQENHAAEALENLLQILKKDKNYNDGEARKMMLDIFNSLGHKDPLVVQYQRQLFSLLY